LKRIVLLGAGGHGVSTIDLVEQTREYEIIGLLDSRPQALEAVHPYPILGPFEQMAAQRAKFDFAFVSVGQIGSPGIRQSLFSTITEFGISCPTLVSPHAYVSKRADVGPGTGVFAGAVVNAAAQIGKNCIINSLALVEHGALIGSSTHISTGARVNGDAQIGQGCFVGSGAVIFQGVNIPDGTIVPAGSIVKKWPKD
jgi:sugar O-acyltransferase (sialic acid O-acetyltransferase NeuD family)